MSIAQNIRYLRKKQGWGQDTLAEKLGYKSYTTVQKWESGVSEPPLKMVHSLAELFHVDINDLVGTDLEFIDKMSANLKKGQPPISEELSFTVSPEERELFEAIHALPEEQKKALAKILGIP